jgi:hypothetical protein
MVPGKHPLRLLVLWSDFFEASYPPPWGRRLTNELLGSEMRRGSGFEQLQA